MDVEDFPPKVFTASGLWIAAALIWYGAPEWAVFAAGWLIAAYGLAPLAWKYSASRALGN